jgi:putative oxidoreductase
MDDRYGLAKYKDVFTSAGLLWLRLFVGLVMAHHGWGKLSGFMPQFIQGLTDMGFPAPAAFAWVAAISEFAGGLCLAAGFFTRFAALSVFITMSVAAFIAHAKDPFQVKELALAYWSASGAMILMGGGTFSADTWLCGRFREKKVRIFRN